MDVMKIGLCTVNLNIHFKRKFLKNFFQQDKCCTKGSLDNRYT